jgi:hypothetical protein
MTDTEKTNETLEPGDQKVETEENQTTEEEQKPSEESDETGEEKESGTEENAEQAQDEGEEQTEEDFVSSFGLPDAPKTLQEALTAYQKLATESSQRELLRKEFQEQPKQTPPPEKGAESLLGSGHVSAMIDQLAKQGLIGDAETQKNARWWANTIDEANKQVFSKVERLFRDTAYVISDLIDAQKESSWARFKNKDLVKKEDLEKFMESRGMFDYNKAFMQWVVKDGALLQKYVTRLSEKGNTHNKQPFRYTGNKRPRGGGSDSGSVYRQYLNRDGTLNESALPTDPDKRIKIVDAYLEGAGKRG